MIVRMGACTRVCVPACLNTGHVCVVTACWDNTLYKSTMVRRGAAPRAHPFGLFSPGGRTGCMSVRQTTEIASEASRFSLRSMFPVSMSAPARAEPEPVYAQEPIPRTGAGLGIGSLSPNSGVGVATSVPEGGIKFSLPRMTAASGAAAPPPRNPAPFLRTPVGPGVTGASTAAAQSALAFSRAVVAAEAGADCIATSSTTTVAMGAAAHAAAQAPAVAPLATGGIASVAADAELGRLRAAMAELQEKLRVSQVRLTTTEASVSRGNTALKTERAQYKQALTSLTNETTALRQREAETKASFDKLMQKQAAFVAIEAKAARAEALRIEVETVTAKHDDMADQLASAQRTNATLNERIGAAQQEFLALNNEKAGQIAQLQTKLAESQVTQASAEKQIDELDERLFRVRSGAEAAAAAATGACGPEKPDCGCADKAPEAASEYGSEYGSQYETETDEEAAEAETPTQVAAATGAPCCAQEGEVLESAAHAVDAIFEGCCGGGDALEPEAEAPIRLTSPVVVALSCCPDACGETARAHVPHAQARHALAVALSAAPLHMGLALVENGGFHAHAHEATGANSESPAAPATPVDTAEGLNPGSGHPAPTATSAAVRTSAYVTAVSSDIKKKMVAHQALWTATRSGPM